MPEPIQTTDTTFAVDVLAAPRPAVIDFWAEWCPPCGAIHGWMERLAHELGEQIVVAQVNVETCPQVVAEYGVQGVPTILLLREGSIVHRQTSELSEGDLRRLVEQRLIHP